MVGAGGHAKVVADAVLQSGQFELEGAVDDKTAESLLLDRIVVKNDFDYFKSRKFIVAIGDNRTRKKCFEQFLELGWHPVNVIHPSAVVSTFSSLQSGIFVGANAVINAASHIENNTIINTGAVVEHDCNIGAHCHLAPGSVVGGGVRVGEGCLVGIGSTVLPLVEMQDWSALGAGSTLLNRLESGKVAVGIPALAKN